MVTANVTYEKDQKDLRKTPTAMQTEIIFFFFWPIGSQTGSCDK